MAISAFLAERAGRYLPGLQPAHMSLGTVLARAHREAVPAQVLEKVAEDDRAVVENIAMVLGAAVPTACVNRLEVARADGQYRLTVPLAAPGQQAGAAGPGQCVVALSELRQVQTHAPSRVADVAVVVERDAPSIRVDVLDAETRMPYSQLEVVRVAKRTRWF